MSGIRFLVWRVGMLATLLPALLVLPTLHIHPAHEHAHEADGTHRHTAIVHADFFPTLTPEHAEPQHDHSESKEPISHSLSQIGFPTILPRSIPALTLSLEKLPAFFIEILVFPSPFLFSSWITVRDHSPPLWRYAFPLSSPRAPPFLV